MIYVSEFIRRYPAIREAQSRVQEPSQVSETAAFDRLKEWCQDILVSLRCMTAPERPSLAYFEVGLTTIV